MALPLTAVKNEPFDLHNGMMTPPSSRGARLYLFTLAPPPPAPRRDYLEHKVERTLLLKEERAVSTSAVAAVGATGLRHRGGAAAATAAAAGGPSTSGEGKHANTVSLTASSAAAL